MRNSNRGGEHLPKKEYSREEVFRRRLSLLLSLCMVVSMFAGVFSFPVLARNSSQEIGQTKTQESAQKNTQTKLLTNTVTETRDEIKARLMWQIRNAGWDPYSGTMSMDEFYALMELFQEGALPLDEKPSETETIKPDAEAPETENPDAEAPETEDSETEAPETEAPETETPDAEAPETEAPDAETPDVEVPDGEDPETEAPGIEGPVITVPETPNRAPSGVPASTAAPEPDTPAPTAENEQDTGPIYIPRTMFLFSGVDTSSMPGKDPKTGTTYDAPQEYINSRNYEPIEGTEGEFYYPRGLDPYGGYTRPPAGWKGIEVGDQMEAAVVVPGINDNSTSVSGDVDQNLFLEYDGVYVRRITAQNNTVTVLGAIQPPKKNSSDPDTWIYYYTNDEKQSTEVSATTLPEGEKFVIHYAPQEHAISYQIRYRVDANDLLEDGRTEIWGYKLVRSQTEYPFPYCDTWEKYVEYCSDQKIDADIADWVRQLPRLELEEQRASMGTRIFSADFPSKTDEGRYAFTATAPDGYTLAFYLSDNYADTNNSGTGDTWKDGQAMLVTPQGFDRKPGKYTAVNQGWALGMEPVYYHDDKLLPNEDKGPQELVTTGTFYNNEVKADRIVVAVLKDKPAPRFDAYSYFHEVDADGGYHGIDKNVDGRGTTSVRTVQAKIKGTDTVVTIPYDYEDIYLWANDGESEYDYFENNSSMGGASKGNLKDGNLATGDGWNWNKTDENVKLLLQDDMTLNEEDGTYSFQWTWQTNSGEGQRGYLLDTLEINRTAITIPFFAKNAKDNSGGYNGEEYPAPYLPDDPDDPEEMGGIKTWFAKTRLPDGAVVKVEFLMAFNSNVQRVYRITVTGAKNNITLTNMNVMQYGSGASEIAVYNLDGVTGATEKDEEGNPTGARRVGMQYYSANNEWNTGEAKYQYNTYRGEVLVDQNGDGVDYTGGDQSFGGANIRFKLAEGYSNPCYLLETSRHGTIPSSTDGGDMASIERDDAGNLIRSTQNPVVPYKSDGDDPYMKYYDPQTDGNIPGVNEGDPIPVSQDGEVLYYKDDNGELRPFTDWTALRISAEAAGEVLVPSLYLKSDPNTPLAKNQVIAGNRVNCFQQDTGNLKSQYIYSGPSGWYYIRLNDRNRETAKMALLTIVAHPTRYVVRYKPAMLKAIYGEDNEVIVEEHAPAHMPETQHSSTCPTFLQGDDASKPHEQFDDNAGYFYDVAVYTDIPISLTRPVDPQGFYQFVDWVLVDENDVPVRQYVVDPENPDQWLEDGNGGHVTREVHFASGSFSVLEYAEFAILNGDLGTTANDIYVLRLMPTWEQVDNPYHYTVALNWIDAQGNLYEEYFSSLWQDVLTNFDQSEGGGPTVKVLTNATPFQNWIARHPTYTFWDPVNNAVTDDEGEEENAAIQAALDDYFPKFDNVADAAENAAWQKKYEEALAAIRKKDREDSKDGDDFARLGNYTYALNEDNGTIVIWMYEDKGGLVFHNEVDPEPFIYDEVFYYTVDQVEMYGGAMLSGEYKAYPGTVCDSFTGEKRDVLDSDAWRVMFKDGKITNIVKNDGSSWPSIPVTYFTLKDGDDIELYVPAGSYTITELGSKSGGSYLVEVRYRGENGSIVPEDTWKMPETDYLKGKDKGHNSNTKQIAVTVDFELGEKNMVRTINFCNQTSALAFENLVIGPYQNEKLDYEASLILPEGVNPLKGPDTDGDGKPDYYYFNFNLYNVTYEDGEEPGQKPSEVEHPGEEPPGRPEGKKPPRPGGEPSKDDEESWKQWYENEYLPWLQAVAAWENELNKYLQSESYRTWLAGYENWLAWHTWKPKGTTSPVSTGRVVVTESTDEDGTTRWVTQYLLVYTAYDVDGNPIEWYRSDGIQLMSGQRFYVVSTVPDVSEDRDINYGVVETDDHGYRPDRGRDREGFVRAAELAYELFINTKLEGLPKTGGMGTLVFSLAGLAFLTSGTGLMRINRKTRRGTAAAVPAERRWGK